jgi:hypothetical protein
MKKLVLVFVVILILGCAKANIKRTEFGSDGKVTVVTEVSSERPIFASTSIAWTSDTGNLNSASSVDMSQMLIGLLSGYLATQTPVVGTAITGGK